MNSPFLAGIFGLQPTEMMIILVIVLLLFGAKKLPELARGLGKSMGEFRRAKTDFEQEIHRAGEEVERAEQERLRREEERKRTEVAAAQTPAPAPAPVSTHQS